jgi:HSP20 family molecular chaperone IbpA
MTDAERRAALRAILRSGPAALARPGALARVAAGSPPAADEPPATREPLVELYAEGDELLVVADLPGASLASLRLSVSGRTLTLGDLTIELPYETQMPPRSVELRNGILEVRLARALERTV